ncbi:hatching enzyme 1.2-like [Arctopsyche grandis]|uniref:hatching enzyme 1.2-like n=1 Tax=Arctopsyche grandis TaxID=121162 RepID=UPI00406D84BC
MHLEARLCLLVLCHVLVLCPSMPTDRPSEDNGGNFVKHCGDKCAGEEEERIADKSVIDEENDEEDVGEEGDYFEGDIVLGDEYVLNPTEYNEDSEEFKNIVLKDSRTWPDKIVYFNFSSEFNSTQRKVVEDAIADMHNVSCIKFVPRTNQHTYLFFRNKKKACAAPVGWKPERGRIDVSLGGRNCLSRRGTVQHELLHALGFWHEHSRTDRDLNILIQWDNILSGREKNFRVRMANESTTLGIPYDFESVMHYKNNSFSRDKRRKPTILPRNPSIRVMMGQRIRISKSDIAKLNRLYRCDKNIYDMGNTIPGAIHWDLFREVFLNERPVYFNKLPEPEPLEFEENKFLYTGFNDTKR